MHNRSTGYTGYYLDLGYHPRFPNELPLVEKTAQSQEEEVPTFIDRMQELIETATTQLRRSQEDMKRTYDRKHRQPERYTTKEWVWLSLPNHKTRTGKLDAKKFGPFRIVKARHPNYELSIPDKETKTYNVDRLQRYVPSPFDVGRPYYPIPENVQEEYHIEQILEHRIDLEGRYQYRIKWLGYDEITWEPRRNLLHRGTPIPILEKYERDNIIAIQYLSFL